MRICESQFAIHAAAALASLGGTPLTGAGIYFAGMAVLTAEYYNCRVGVVDAWRICRKYNPIR